MENTSRARNSFDAVVVGGGFYGAAVATYLKKTRNLERVLLLEREASLLACASYRNQARVHNGYHYPRSFTTAYRSRINFPRFVLDWPDAIERDFTKLYAIARRNSKVTARQFLRFCQEIGASIRPVTKQLSMLFSPHLIEAVFLAEEYSFNAVKLAQWASNELDSCGVMTRLNVEVSGIERDSEDNLFVLLSSNERISCRYVFNCTYSGLNHLGGDFPGVTASLKHEIAELALIEMPEDLRRYGITVMDGPYFSIMPFPARSLHTLTHVRYTPHLYWQDAYSIDPYEKLASYSRLSRVDRMLRDVERYIPKIRLAKYHESMFEIKTVLVKNESDDGRPILFEKHESMPGCYSILGGKIDNIYDVLEKLDAEKFE